LQTANTVITISSVVDAHGELVIVQRKVAVPTTNPVTPDVGEEGVVIVAVPETTDHKPVPTLGVLAASVVVVEPPHRVWSGPAFAILTNVIFTSSVEAVHGEFDIVQRKVYAVPDVPLNVDVRLVGTVTVPPEPLIILHAPVPMLGALAASVV
jgi:hypothetical protein